jgi:hypothetical protein
MIDEKTATPTRRRTKAVLAVTITSLLLTTAFVVRNLAASDWNPSVFLALGADIAPTRDYAYALLGEDLDLRAGRGHDGKFFFAQANDPLLLDPEAHAAVLDRPVYRSQRILFPLLASGFGLLSPWGVVWGMLVLSVLSIAAGTYATALVARGMGGSPWWGLTFGLNIGVISELLVGGAGHLGFALVVFSVAAIQRGQSGWSLVALTGAVLAREVLLIGVAGIALWLWQRSHRRLAVLHMTVPVLAVVAWGIYVRIRIGWMTGVTEIEEIGWPFVGLWQAAKLWPESPKDMLVGVAIVVLLALFARRLVRSRWLVGYVAAGFVPVALLLTLQVWFSYFDITRAVSPVITAFLLLAFAAHGQNEEHVALSRRT